MVAQGIPRFRPAASAILDPTRAQMRGATLRFGHLITEAEDLLEEASGVIANGYLRLDRQEWIRTIEKRQAALGD